MFHFGFSYMGLIFLVMLFIPNMLWTKHKPKGYEKYFGNENKILLLFERTGEVLVSCISLIFTVLIHMAWDCGRYGWCLPLWQCCSMRAIGSDISTAGRR